MNRVLSAIRLALSTIARAKVRSALTVLGILIGVAAVVIVSALGTGVQQRVANEIKSLGSNTLFILQNPTSRPGRVRAPVAADVSTEADGKAIAREANSVMAVVPFLSAEAQVIAGDRNVATTVMGSSRAYFEVRGFTFRDGGSFSESDENIKGKVCVLGSTVKESFFGNQDAVGQIVRIGRYAFRVVGVLASKGQSPSGEDQDDRIVMPSGTFRARILPTSPGRVHMLIASATDPLTVERAQAQIESILRQRHHIDPQREADFGVRSQAEFLRTQEEIFGTLRMLLLGIALVSLGVGGVGVMNIMLVSVTERTREIGIRMAIGARASDIRFQFLVEAVTLCMLGGFAGTAAGLGGMYGLVRVLGWSMFLPPEALVAALSISFGTGIVFGFLPANNAARLDPIEALRRE